MGRADLELDDRNFITLCERPLLQHHLLLGHLGSWQSFNRDIATTFLKFGRMSAREMKASPRWITACTMRAKLFDFWTSKERDEVRATLDRVMPKRG